MKKILFVLGPLLFSLLLFVPLSLLPAQQSLAAIMAWVVCWWLHPDIPLPVTGLIGLCLATLLGVAGFEAVLVGFSNPVLFLFMGGFLLAQAMYVHKLDEWIAHRCLQFKIIGGKPKRVVIAITLLATTFSMVLSNTATAAMFVPIALSLLTHLKVDNDHPSAGLVLIVAYAATIGGIGTPIGSPPNVIALSLLDKISHVKIGFIEWMMKMVPVMLICLSGLFVIFWKELSLLPKGEFHDLQPVPPLSVAQKRLIAVLLMTVFLWILPGIFQLILGLHHPSTIFISKKLPEGLVALLMSSLLFVVPSGSERGLLIWNEAKRIDWATLLLFGTGISLGQLMVDSELTKVLGEALPFHELPYALSLLIICTFTLFGSEFMSNAAIANLLIPLALSTSPFKEAPIAGSLALCLSASLAFMLPVGTPPNAIAFGTGRIKIGWMLKKGFWLNLVCLVTIWLASWLFF